MSSRRRRVARRAAGRRERTREDGAGASLRGVRRSVRTRDADAGAGRARAGVGEGPGGRGVPHGACRAAARLRRAPDAALSRPQAVGARRTARVFEARGPQPHGFAQAQQRPRPGAAGQAHGKAADHRRDGRGPARRGDGDGVRAAGLRVRRVHGRGGHAQATAERAEDGAVGGHGAAGGCRREDVEGGDLGGDPRLGDERAEHALRDRLGRGPGALSGPRARSPAGDRRRGAGAAARARGQTAGAGGGVRGRRFECDGHVHRVPRRRAGRAGRGGGRRRRDRDQAARRPADRGRARGHPARRALGRDAGRGGADRGGALGVCRARLSRAQGPSTPSSGTAAGRGMWP